MAVDKYFYLDANSNPHEKAAAVTSTPNAIVGLDASGKINENMLPTGVGAEIKVIQASEALAAGDFVNIYNDTTIKCRKADASGGEAKKAHGFVKASVDSGANASIYLSGINDQLSSLTPGTKYFLSATPGTVTTTAPTTTNHGVQEIGIALSATEIPFSLQPMFIRA